MFRSFFSRPVVRRFLSNSFVLLVYSALALFFAVCTWAGGLQSGCTVPSGLLTYLFGGIVYQEIRYCITGTHAVHRRG